MDGDGKGSMNVERRYKLSESGESRKFSRAGVSGPY
jgi:hypothetical protein